MFRDLLYVINRRKDDLTPAKFLPEPVDLGFQPIQGLRWDPSGGGTQRDLGRRVLGVGGGQVELQRQGWEIRDGEELSGVERDGHREDRGDGEANSGGERRDEEELGIDGGDCAELSRALVGGGE